MTMKDTISVIVASTQEIRIMKHIQNQHGWSVSLTTYENGMLTNGFVLNTFETEPQQDLYISELQEFSGWQMDEMPV